MLGPMICVYKTNPTVGRAEENELSVPFPLGRTLSRKFYPQSSFCALGDSWFLPCLVMSVRGDVMTFLVLVIVVHSN